ncbi:circadian clock protein KaiB [Rhodoferax sp. 4810]|uniref:Circadian clock protein KaiB n=1 Tax=Thiospirillum jenense TaxID=1653858 RepID=A0A839HBW3_9GAMM|nr:circadian clock KaiB family protein [Thiospirillum jenense]MBB1074342.1 circadian clock protein KaiB [Rhodoferax jenense]MBB1126453.1 circadian clock protein KaiB [Thiospirillum jenense]
MLSLKLYVTGLTPSSQQLIQQLRTLLTHYYADDYTLAVLDIFEHPQEAYDDVIYATPTLVKILPLPVTQIIGNLSDRERVLAGLQIKHLQPIHFS